ncbi:MAG: type 1 glutamine amidotransferase [Methanospirillum sp.]|uniref:type 1 glutamine amidotransferase n=1 Tax=Methanospirillum sp. TaxID=45200 RepID=UPI002370805A|nr:type 1 glutamine amidotransferase [Methanospirillum sp.]MDD1727901.1 type 1 glutamine amidotransferase [Methanospirillum sp.]
MHIYSLEHDYDDKPVFISRWLELHNYTLTHIRLYKGDPLPDPDLVDLLIIMGGAMNIYEESTYPWLVPEKVFIRKVIDSGTPVLGICLGGQLIASVLGGTVTRSETPEFGWHSIRRVSGVTATSLHHATITGVDLFPDSLTVFQWHHDTFSIPTGAVHLYASETCGNQAFLYGSRVIGLQFHPEMDDSTIRKFINQSKGDMTEHGLLPIHDDTLSRIQLFSIGNEFVSGLLQYLTSFSGIIQIDKIPLLDFIFED